MGQEEGNVTKVEEPKPLQIIEEKTLYEILQGRFPLIHSIRKST